MTDVVTRPVAKAHISNGVGETGRMPVLLAGERLGAPAGGAVSAEVLLGALSQFAQVDVLSHRMSARPTLRETTADHAYRAFELGTQPITVHGEALAAGWSHRRRFRKWSCAWAATSRYAGSLFASGVPYVVWEATTARDELDSIDIKRVRSNGTGTGLGASLHRMLGPLDARLEGAIYRGASRLLAMSEYTRDLMMAQHQLGAGQVQVLNPPPSIGFLDALAERMRAAAESPFTRPAKLLFVGRVSDPRKNAALLIDAFRLVRAVKPNATLTIVGPYTDQWAERSGARQPGSGITLAGALSVSDLVAAYLTHDVLMVSSRQEGYGLVVAEALHAGLPVVATKCGGPEAIIRASGGGAIAEHTPYAIADAVLVMLANDGRWLSCARNAGAFARRELSFDRFVSRVFDITCSVARLSGGATLGIA